MNHDIAQGNWKQLSGKIKQKWGKLTDDDLMRAQGDKEYLVGKLHEQYGIAKDKAEDELQTLGFIEDGQDEGSGIEKTRDGYGNSTGSVSNRSDKLNAGSNRQDAAGSGMTGNRRQQPGSGSFDQEDSDDSQEPGNSSFRERDGADHTLESAGSSGQGSPSNRSGSTGNSKPGSKGGRDQGNSAPDKSTQQKGGRGNPSGGGRS